MNKQKGIINILFILAIFIVIALLATFILHQKLTRISSEQPDSLTSNIAPTSKNIVTSESPSPANNLLVSSATNDANYFTGEISPRVPYLGLKFREIDIHNFTPLAAELDKNDFHYDKLVIDGYTFAANKGEDFEFVAEEDFSSNPGSFISTEFYGWGPTVVKMDTRIGIGIPATTRYFYVVKGEDVYGPHFVVPDGSGRIIVGSKYGRYTLKITQRK